MPRLDRGIQYSAALVVRSVLQLALWNTGSPGQAGDGDSPKSKGGLKARRFLKMIVLALGARAERGSTQA
jgi:hypothetical protein